MLQPHQYKLLLLYVKNYQPISARKIQCEIEFWGVSSGTATVMAATFIVEAVKNGDISLEPNTGDIFAKEKGEDKEPAPHEQAEPGKNSIYDLLQLAAIVTDISVPEIKTNALAPFGTWSGLVITTLLSGSIIVNGVLGSELIVPLEIVT